MAMISRKGFGQVEPNHLSAQRNGQVYGQLPAAADIAVLENGQFVKYDYANGVCNFEGAGEWMLVLNEVKLYDGWRESYKDFALRADRYDNGVITPRVMKTMPGDIFTTNMVPVGVEYAVGDKLVPTKDNTSKTLVLTRNNSATTGMIWQVVKVYTMPDGQPGLKVQRVQ